MEYQVPQFIEIESKIVGPLTLKQFIYLAGSGGLCVVCFFYLPLIFAVLLSAGIAAFGISLAFYRMNGKPFIEMLEAGFSYYTRSKLFLWQRHEATPEKVAPPVVRDASASSPTPRLTSGKLSELAWTLDMQNHEREIGKKPPAKPE